MAKSDNYEKLPMDPGGSLRALRTERGWTLAEVSRRTSLPVSTLSKIENGKMSLTYDKLVRITSGLDVEFVELFSPTQIKSAPASQPPAVLAGRRSINRLGEGFEIDAGKYFYRYLAGDFLNKQFVPIYGEVRARSLEEFGEMIRHPGEEFVYVIEGVIEVHSEFYAPVRLETGESIYFDSQMAHAYIAGAPGRCSMLSICSAAEHDLIDALKSDHGAESGVASSGKQPRKRRAPK